MKYEKSIWERSINFISIDNLPHWPCPLCETGKLKLRRKSLRFKESVRQFDEKAFRKEDFEENVLLGVLSAIVKATSRMLIRQARYNAFLICDNEDCKEVITICGRAEVPSQLQNISEVKITSFILPEYFSPPLKIFPLPNEYPQAVREELARSFTIFFADSSAAGNKLRIAIERLLDALSVGSRSEKIHKRLVQLNKQYPQIGDILMDVKWLGNEASHWSDLSKKKILYAYQVVEYVLKQLFIHPAECDKIKKLSKGLRTTQ